jgi:hypothetical protein
VILDAAGSSPVDHPTMKIPDDIQQLLQDFTELRMPELNVRVSNNRFHNGGYWDVTGYYQPWSGSAAWHEMMDKVRERFPKLHWRATDGSATVTLRAATFDEIADGIVGLKRHTKEAAACSYHTCCRCGNVEVQAHVGWCSWCDKLRTTDELLVAEGDNLVCMECLITAFCEPEPKPRLFDPSWN